MADAHKEMIAIATALEISQEEFQRIFDDNLQKLQDAYIRPLAKIEVSR